MMNNNVKESNIVNIKDELKKYIPNSKDKIMEKVVLAALGSIPWVGSFLSEMASFRFEKSEIKTSILYKQWLEEHENKLRELMKTLENLQYRFDSLGSEIDSRISSEEYLSLVRKGFRTWENASTKEKKQYMANLLANAAGTKLCTDDVVRLFMDWLEIYHELHFSIIRSIYKTPGITRYEIWCELKDENLPREDSAEADLFKYIIRELSTGGVIRQIRDITSDGRFLKRRIPKKSSHMFTIESAFENSKGYLLTALGQQFVHYTMNDVVNRLEE